MQQRSNCLGVPSEIDTEQETLRTIERLFTKKSLSVPEEVKSLPEPNGRTVIPKVEELPLATENNQIFCNFEFACYLTKIVQKIVGMQINIHKAPRQYSLGIPKVPEKKKLEVKKQRRIDRFGELVVDRSVNSISFRFPFDPQESLTPTSIQSGSNSENLTIKSIMKDIDLSNELVLKPMQDTIYKDIYVFSDTEDNMEDIDRRYKYLNNGFRAFLRQRKDA